ncbi:hypothetical protein PIB30_051350 [Stylosanthes scabra]|uniref:Uncharacterized protein n=1 Tax=Stylosanthes scabra TaxID=79078 RepID=A0ABU6XH08_9FABA|nr:hypothetical protein [Stylosanthes scabra]
MHEKIRGENSGPGRARSAGRTSPAGRGEPAPTQPRMVHRWSTGGEDIIAQTVFIPHASSKQADAVHDEEYAIPPAPDPPASDTPAADIPLPPLPGKPPPCGTGGHIHPRGNCQ